MGRRAGARRLNVGDIIRDALPGAVIMTGLAILPAMDRSRSFGRPER